MKNKIEIINTKPKVTKSELEAFMDFDALLDQGKVNATSNEAPRKTLPLFSLFFLGLLVLCLAGYLYLRPSNQEIIDIPIKEKEISSIPNDVISIEAIAEEVSSQSENNPQKDQSNNQKTPLTKKDQKTNSSQKSNAIIKEKTEITPLPESGYEFIEAKPTSGMKDLYLYFAKELKYPKHLESEKIEGEVLVNFTIDKLGKIRNLKIEKSLGSSFDQEAIRVIEKMPEWIPATINGTKIDSKLSIPLYFNIEN